MRGKRRIFLYIGFVLIVVSLSACGAESEVQNLREEGEYRCCNDKYLYYLTESPEEGDYGIFQCQRDGSAPKKIVIPEYAPEGKESRLSDLYQVEREWIYYQYQMYNKEDDSEDGLGSGYSTYFLICRAPLRRDSSGETILFDQQEELAELHAHTVFWLFYAQDDYLVCSEGNSLVRIQISDRKKTILGEKFEGDIFSINDVNGNRAYGNGVFYCECITDDSHSIIYQVDPESGARQEIWGKEQEEKSDDVDSLWWRIFQDKENDQVYINTDGDKLWRYDRNTKKTECIFLKKQIKKQMKKIKPWGKKDIVNYDIDNFFIYKNRIYFAMEIVLRKNGLHETGHLVFSCSRRDCSDLRYEKEISGVLLKEAYPRTIEYDYAGEVVEEDVVTGGVLFLLEDTLVMETTEDLELEEGLGTLEEYQLILYDLKTGKYRLCGKEDQKYREFCWGGGCKTR